MFIMLASLTMDKNSNISKCTFSVKYLKGTVHQKMEIHPLSTHHYADGGVGEVFESTKTCEVSGLNFVRTESNTIEVNADLFFRHNKTTDIQIQLETTSVTPCF